MSIVAKKIIMGSGAVAEPSDDEFNRTSFLSHFDGSNDGVNNQFTDGSASNHTITANGNVTQGSFGPFARPDGEWGVSFDGASDYLDANDGPTFGTGAFTIEFFVNLRTVGSTQGFFDARPDSTNGLYPALFVYSNNTLVYYVNTGDRITSSETLSANTWYHIAVCRSGTSTKLFLDGTQVGSTFSDSHNYPDSGRMRVGTSGFQVSDGFHVDGVISNVRVVNSALYTSNFTPPTAALTAITNTKLLTCQSNRFVDNSASAHTITPSGNPAVTAFGPILTSSVYKAAVNGASLYNGVNVDGNYLSAADSADWNLGSGNYTVECWAYATAQGSFNKLVGQWQYEGANAANSWILETVGTDMEAYAIIGGSAVLIAQGAAFTINQWHHVALVRNGNNHNIYIDGVAGSTTSNSGTYANGTGALEIGSFSQLSGGSWDGYITDVRVVKGTAVYTSNFAPPTAPLTAITNTKLLLNMADGQAIDSAAQNNLTLVGNTDTSTGQAKFGNTSLFYDGSGDGAYYANGAALGTGDWTIETFLWVNDFDANLGVFQYGGADGALGSMVLTNQKIRVLSSNVAARLDTSGTINAQTWYHVAYVSYSGTIKVYINGTADSTTFDASSTTWTFTDTNIYVGARYYSSAVQAPFDGYLDEFRVSHFARYTANFTAPTKAFADKGQ